MNLKRLLAIVLLLVWVIGCGPKVEKVSGCGRSNTYDQNFKSDIAWVVLEWNCKPYGYGSGFLIDKEKGAFYTNKHVSNMFDALGKGSHKIFFNGKVYNAAIVRPHLLVDVALVKITDSFDFSEFPDTAPIADSEPITGDSVWIEGLHPHPLNVREADEADGFKFLALSVYKDHYRLSSKENEDKTEIVFEKFEALIEVADTNIKIGGQGQSMVQDIRNLSNLYMGIRTKKDHRFPFGGLSGTVVRNSKGETVGIMTGESTEADYDKDKVQPLGNGYFVAERVYKMAAITPIKAVNDLKKYLD
ncbi:MAG: hypothetical protein A3B91_04165 [Candidatus Yanofskybacteria bacterium RIFCSPHIGHO2_02_FULL_41_29]|uniref:Serine protease n=1 Tax=Candidatus Yanofskybacteria bacterium RIFCSPHIGHO2_01_FULL_41_53 TaxID=1802663 RepID=A0A1F8EHE6_9BACT|nr:MAG: hypothetical protein A2650_02880 [Candidatus Yanofskybacteria bacterium RIFCSPHIGHO2_01_FULL_41_53]OGN10496.1 MAG: hypothetical protein A3B91_04165 [Candidatus Yanofskybacteria bacterium RIFCSPHIGHO2_02_FULL_41_29]OGN21543.1 MAG: hypothetical protein A2916_04645 [Candidatus Yanofskybacteria bacterium RIFCSPLOWO2_01_FULL_41_67]OGN29683.1 MAG: hypothetical protein A3H54_02865 [Candidatus Yanofskybacteria bacterium RIFCSPLOWO2_02_FULL_41_13]